MAENKNEQSGMDNRDCLATLSLSSESLAEFARGGAPIALRDWLRSSSESSLRDFLDRFAYDCLWRAEARSKSACGVHLPDLEQPRPPDAPPGMVKLRLIKKT